MLKTFRIHYNTEPGTKMLLYVSKPSAEAVDVYEMTDEEAGFHSFACDDASLFHYRYAVSLPDGPIVERHWRLAPQAVSPVSFVDVWRSPESESDALMAPAFAEAVFGGKPAAQVPAPLKAGSLVLALYEPRIGANEELCVISKQLINWKEERAFPMVRYANSLWMLDLGNIHLLNEFEFKFAIRNVKDGSDFRYEEGQNRVVRPANGCTSVFSFNGINAAKPWRAAGVAVPVFSLRTSKSRGCGEFLDLKALADWCTLAHLKVIQLLPINDTTAIRQWRDSYPYNAISIMALHPSYISVDEVFEYYGKRMCGVERETGLYLNDSPLLEYNRVRDWKDSNLRRLFNDNFEVVMADAKLRAYLDQNAFWLKDYAAFATLRDKFSTPKFREWPEFSTHTPQLVDDMFKAGSEFYREVCYRVFLQYHLERQMCDAVDYVHSKGIALKGDLPIGINPNSVEAWTSAELFDFGMQAGAPPDFFSHDGQNWGFPTYKWDVMKQDGYAWWGRRMSRMQMFFDAFRIDHILGFFRIWSIPFPFRSGLMGLFSPALPFSKEELALRGFAFNPEEYAVPNVTEEFFRSQVGEYSDAAFELFDRAFDGTLTVKPENFTPVAIDSWIEKHVEINARERIRQGLANILHEVLFVTVKEGEYHPRILLEETDRFRRLPEHMRGAMRDIYNDFFFRRHETFWKNSAEDHLGGLVNNCRMLVCGEDLGMIPSTVPMVMNRMQILSLELQRMPKESWQRFGAPAYYPYLSVCASSSHDISGIRGWWEEDRNDVEYYYHNVMGRSGAVPATASPEIAAFVVGDHMRSGSMLCINPIQDYAAMTPDVPRLMPFEERINVPSNPEQMWRYRVPFVIDKLADWYPSFHKDVAAMVDAAGRHA